ncbi:MAG: type IV pilus biogenesis/stability protein PilW [Oleiphilaceae bacterium]|nr:type IV pilus biogenesis/stability protein PilW [Oleiphilaceae bacterium]
MLSACVTTSDSNFARKADPSVAAEKYVQLGLEYIKRNELIRARKHLKRALQLDPQHAAAHAALGLIYHEDAENKLAEKSFKQAIEIDPTYTRGRTYYGAFLFSQERFQEALEQFQLASEDTGYASRDQVFTNIALCHLKLGNNAQALEAYEKTLRLDRFNGRALAGATELLIEQDDFQRAQNYYNRLVRLIAQQGMKHSPQSLWMGIRIARYYGSVAQEESLSTLLAELYPQSAEYRAYKKLRSKGYYQ